ncbi:hypothetical protein GA0074692_3478 [Micromonospora pallida]|uniref:NLI interacting factor-like phosphatase n=1 Tax=Micromonospora pallida TaxID=145854 RepID=A0A1C6SUJ7_9ACTN|nr:hypothetical protein [Micromonospora pallida]SCL33049.1 hypothetical protein GA0074692_3478 [Micromonospora pallida]
MTALPPIWLLDVDGVLNVTSPAWGGVPDRHQVWSAADSYAYRFCWAPGLIDRIHDLHRDGVVEVVWCTTWCAEADLLERLWALPALRRAFTAPFRDAEASAAKLAAARQVLADGRRLVWTDDLEVPTGGPVYDELTAHGRALLIRPATSHGLRRRHLNEIEIFARNPSTGDA